MPRKNAASEDISEDKVKELFPETEKNNNSEVENLNRMLGAVLNYISDEEVVEIDIEYILDKTEGLRKWWELYRENNRKHIEEEIKKSLGELSLKELEKIRKQIEEKQS
ncbi:hypothetical protein [Neobacillus terrae]|uniref:hypothetical protein n=1 Tax=Neobacillus terrae TaxID=3034837 RepID=UPI00140B1614|nr:hypothetical protein [Neobacillus terrae]NHM30928.1 hypothetical protein [Neobacillus terrae]